MAIVSRPQILWRHFTLCTEKDYSGNLRNDPSLARRCARSRRASSLDFLLSPSTLTAAHPILPPHRRCRMGFSRHTHFVTCGHSGQEVTENSTEPTAREKMGVTRRNFRHWPLAGMLNLAVFSQCRLICSQRPCFASLPATVTHFFLRQLSVILYSFIYLHFSYRFRSKFIFWNHCLH